MKLIWLNFERWGKTGNKLEYCRGKVGEVLECQIVE